MGKILLAKDGMIRQETEEVASSKEYLGFVLDQLSGIRGIAYRKMMGEYIIYYNGRIVGGIYDDRFLVKPVPSARKLMLDARLEKPYDGAKEMLLADIDNRELMEEVILAMYDELPDARK